METPELPDRPLTAEEDVGNRILKGASYEINMGSPRRVLTADELYDLKDARPRFEKELRLPLDARGATSRVCMFTVDGMYRGTAIKGALFAGECMLIQADSFEKALKLAKDGLRSTLDALAEEYDNRSSLILPDLGAANAGVSVDAAGRRGQVSPANDPDLLRSDPLMKAILATEIGKLPWKH